MISRKTLGNLILLAFLVYNTNISAQDQNLDYVTQQLIFGNLNDNNYFYDGQINLKNNEVLEGSMSLNQIHDGEYSVILKTEDGCIYIPNKEINTVTLFDTIDKKSVETIFVFFEGRDKLYRELYQKDSNTAIYDLLEKPFDNRIMNDVFILENNNFVSINDFWTSGPKKDIINYLNNRDGTDYKRRDFNSLKDLFDKL